MLTNCPKCCCQATTPILISLHWLPVNFRIHFKILVLTYRALHGQATQYISDLLHPYTASRDLRSSTQGFLSVPRTHFKIRGDQAFQSAAPKLWNTLPTSLRSLDNVDSFKKQLKTHLFRQAFGQYVIFYLNLSILSALLVYFLWCLCLLFILILSYFIFISLYFILFYFFDCEELCNWCL